MTGAINGHAPAMANRYAELVDMTQLPGRTQDEFREAFEALVGRLSTPLTPEEYQLAYTAGREMWRACWWSQMRARAAEVRRGMDERDETLFCGVRIELERADDPATVGKRR